MTHIHAHLVRLVNLTKHDWLLYGLFYCCLDEDSSRLNALVSASGDVEATLSSLATQLINAIFFSTH